ncbi:hypothetical protein EIP86_003007 [Pleurotus ostreatoroseus]|nr:hypothetical protein EIP86_003007 [Pleurotus ostreatoroseus]
MPLHGLAADNAETPMAHIAVLGRASNEEFDVLHAECRPGDRVCDVFAEQVEYHMDCVDGVVAPPKAQGDQLQNWVDSRLIPAIAHIENDPRCAIVFTDGSQKKGAGGDGDVAAGAAWYVKHSGTVREGHFGCGKATPYDAEMAALARGLREATRDLPSAVSDIHLGGDHRKCCR